MRPVYLSCDGTTWGKSLPALLTRQWLPAQTMIDDEVAGGGGGQLAGEEDFAHRQCL